MSQTRHILVIDDDNELRQALAEQLALQDEYQVSTADTAAAAREFVAAKGADLLIMDVGLPDMDGREALRQMRAEGFRRPVIMLTAHDSDADAVIGLESGANDYIAKPFRFAVLLARIRVQLRQFEATDDAEFAIGPFLFRPGAKILVDGKGEKIRLTEKETAILRFLHRADRQIVAREVLLKDVWGYNKGVTTHTLETHIYRLRQKIEVDPAHALILVTEAGGYRLRP